MNRTQRTEGGNRWEDLRKHARQMENDIDLKLVSFSKLGTNGRHFESFDGSSNSKGSNNERMLETMSMEIENIISKLTSVNDDMSDYTQRTSMKNAAPNGALMHTLTRHREILEDYRNEFVKTRKNITDSIQRDNLMGSVKRDVDTYNNGMNRRTDMYLKEHDHIRSSDRLIDEQISIAMATKDNLINQKTTLKKITEQMLTLTNRFPVINSLVTKINMRKKRDTVIIGVVISICLILLMLYLFH